MSIFSALNSGASGLGVSSEYLATVGDNIANINTTGYKQTRISFADFMPQDVFGLGGGGQIGTGAVVNTVSTVFGQGTLESTGSATDMAISGNGFFVVSDGSQQLYTRNGEFGLDADGYLVSQGGLNVQGYTATNGSLSKTVGDIQIDTDSLPGTPTSTVVINAALSADEDVSDDLSVLDFFGTGAGSSTLTEAGDAADFTTSITTYDSLGVAHDVTLLFERTGDSTWSYRAVTDASEVYDSTGTAYTTETDYPFEMASGSLTFDTDGVLTAVTQTSTTGYTFQGAAEPELTFDFGLDTTGAATDGALTMAGESSAITAISQDGSSTGTLSSLSVDSDGTILGSYSNGDQVTLGQVALASFAAAGGLERVGGTLFAATKAAGAPVIGAAGSGALGNISGYALEKSNVELEDQFVAMITAQRSYQASSRVISTVNDTLGSLLQIV